MNEEQEYKAPKVHDGLDPHYVWGSLEHVLRMIAELPEDSVARRRARFALENLADPSEHIQVVGGTRS